VAREMTKGEGLSKRRELRGMRGEVKICIVEENGEGKKIGTRGGGRLGGDNLIKVP